MFTMVSQLREKRDILDLLKFRQMKCNPWTIARQIGRERAGDLRRRKSGKEAREVKVEKVKIGKNGKGRY